MSDSSITYREAVQADLQGITDIGDVYGGIDTHVTRMATYLQQPQYKCYVMEHQAKIVSHLSLYLPYTCNVWAVCV
jgi:N-acetylglutamate synthase-like GNAT family acetyltransferase